MNRLILAGLCLLVAGPIGSAWGEEPAPVPAAPAPYMRGVNLAGPEFGGKVPGVLHKDYTFNNQKSFEYFAKKGLTVIRVPIKWDRLQPKPSGEFDAAYFEMFKKNVAWAREAGAKVLIDLHNYGRRGAEYKGERKGFIIGQEIEGEVPVKIADFQDVWRRLSKEFKDEPAIFGYGLMNEPHDMGTSDWKAISNAAVEAIRANGDKNLILVAGLSWSNARAWERHNGAESWVKDSADNFMYEAHCYFDVDNSGQYKLSYEDELKKNPKMPEVGRARVKDFTDWCRKNKVRGFLGEFGVPRDDPRWNEVLENFLQELDAAGMGGTYWAAGIFWGDRYPLTLHPSENFTQDRPQMAVLLKHLGPGQKDVSAAEPAPVK
ncbi:MAG: glycoside hydrolase family 5 protein [Planctomycetota bacterium]|nr:glycoside hydrolase family 5 protein [Planctomycetota bacterium]